MVPCTTCDHSCEAWRCNALYILASPHLRLHNKPIISFLVINWYQTPSSGSVLSDGRGVHAAVDASATAVDVAASDGSCEADGRRVVACAGRQPVDGVSAGRAGAAVRTFVLHA